MAGGRLVVAQGKYREGAAEVWSDDLALFIFSLGGGKREMIAKFRHFAKHGGQERDLAYLFKNRVLECPIVRGIWVNKHAPCSQECLHSGERVAVKLLSGLGGCESHK